MSEWKSVEEDGLPEPGHYYAVVQYRYCDEESRQKYGYERVWNKRYLNPSSNHFLGEDKLNNPVTHYMEVSLP